MRVRTLQCFVEVALMLFNHHRTPISSFAFSLLLITISLSAEKTYGPGELDCESDSNAFQRLGPIREISNSKRVHCPEPNSSMSMNCHSEPLQPDFGALGPDEKQMMESRPLWSVENA